MPGIGIITNPHSKLNKRRPGTPQLLGYILGEHGRLAITQSLKDLSRVAEKFRDSNIEILAINGGDGTISKTLTAFIDAYGGRPLPKVALLRGGTMNVLASNLGIRGTPPRILYRLCEAYSGDVDFKTITLTSLKVEESYGFLYADGIAYTVLDEFYQNKSGPVGAALLVGKLALSALVKGEMFRRMVPSQKITLTTALGTNEHRTLSLMASTIERMPYGFRFFADARRNPKQFQYTSVHIEPEELIKKIPSIVLLNKAKNYSCKLGGLTESLMVKGGEGYPYSLDGELFHSTSESFKISTGPQINFIVV